MNSGDFVRIVEGSYRGYTGYAMNIEQWRILVRLSTGTEVWVNKSYVRKVD